MINLIKLEKISGFLLSVIILGGFGFLVSGGKFELNEYVLLLTYILAAINIVLGVYNRGGKANRTISIILIAILMVGLILGMFAFY